MKLLNTPKQLANTVKVITVSMVKIKTFAAVVKSVDVAMDTKNTLKNAVQAYKAGHPVAAALSVATQVVALSKVYGVQWKDLESKKLTKTESQVKHLADMCSQITGFTLDEIKVMPGECVVDNLTAAYTIRAHEDHNSKDGLYEEGLKFIKQYFGSHYNEVVGFNEDVAVATMKAEEGFTGDKVEVDETFKRQYNECSSLKRMHTDLDGETTEFTMNDLGLPEDFDPCVSQANSDLFQERIKEFKQKLKGAGTE